MKARDTVAAMLDRDTLAAAADYVATYDECIVCRAPLWQGGHLGHVDSSDLQRRTQRELGWRLLMLAATVESARETAPAVKGP